MLASTTHEESSLPWVEKYRPKCMSDIASQSTVVSVLRQSMQSDNLPHLLFYGPPGTGKTSTILALARELFGPTLFRQRILELNASDERGINVIREKVKNFAKVTVKETVPGFPCPPFKLIILDEADSLTTDAQTALRRTIEQYSRSTRFCLICNYVSRIIDPLTSRCAKFRFGAVEEDAAVARLEMICNTEGIQHDRDALLALISTAEGDLRRAITLLQGIHRLRKPLTRATVDSLSGSIPASLIDSAVQLCLEPAQPTAHLTGFINALIRDAHSPTAFLHQMLAHLLTSNVKGSTHTALLVSKLAECEARIGEGADETVQVLHFLTEMRAVFNPRESVLYRTGSVAL